MPSVDVPVAGGQVRRLEHEHANEDPEDPREKQHPPPLARCGLAHTRDSDRRHLDDRRPNSVRIADGCLFASRSNDIINVHERGDDVQQRGAIPKRSICKVRKYS